MANVTALQSFTGVLRKDVLGPDRIERHSEFKEPSVFPGGLGFPAGSLERNIKTPGEKVTVVKGQKYDSNHPIVKKWPGMFGGAESLHLPAEATA